MATLNKQVVEAIIVTNEEVLGDAVVASYAVAVESYAHSLTLSMHNAITAQFAGCKRQTQLL